MNEIVVIDGVVSPLAAASLPLLDQGVSRGDGAFETIGVWDGKPFRLNDHLIRLNASLRAARLPVVDHDQLMHEIGLGLGSALRDQPLDAALRLYVTASGTRIVSVSAQPQRPPNRWVQPMVAPWIRPVGSYELAGAKTMSYMPNMVASRAAVASGADDALLVSLEGVVLEGPTFAVAWVTGGVLYAPSVDLGIIDSVSRRAVLELADAKGMAVQVGSWGMGELLAADEIMTSSSVRALRALERVGEHILPSATPVTNALAEDLENRRRRRS